MVDFEIVLKRGVDGERHFSITDDGLIVGRSPDAGINLTDQLVSRRHARIWLENGEPVIEDLGSRNGITVNGRKVQRAILHDGDEIGIGDRILCVSPIFGQKINRAVITPENAEVLHASIINDSSSPRLPVLYRSAQLLGSVFDLDELLNQILGLIFEALPVRRGFILTMPPDMKEPVIHATRSLDDSMAVPPLSHTMIKHVFEHKEAILTFDAQDDSRFDLAESIMQYEIRSAMCVPMYGRQAVAGAIYVDSGATPTRFSNSDLELLTAIGRVVGIAVENARLYRENVERERMAAIGQATAGLGHCIKNILTGIRGGGEIITRALEEKNLSFLEKGWSILSRSIERIDMLVMNMLTYSKEREPQYADTDLNQLVRDVFEMLRPRAERYHVELQFASENAGLAFVDGPQIYRVILNLVLNGIEACEREGGKVTVTTAFAPEGVHIAVADTGAGIPPEVRPKLFQAFVSSKGSSGTGLGLACAQKIIQEHGGTISVESEPGHGALFTIFFPGRPA